MEKSAIWLSVRGLSKTYKSGRGIRDLSFELGRGINAFVGKNGAGKTTTLQIIMGHARADAGTVAVFGEPVRDGNAYRLRTHISYLPSTDVFEDYLSIDENFALFNSLFRGRLSASAYERNLECLEMRDFRKSYFQTLSTGEKRKAQLAVVLASQDEILILDEPANGVDILSLKTIKNLLLENTSRCVLVSTHIAEIVDGISQSLVVIDEGQILCSREVGPDERIFETYLGTIEKSRLRTR